MARRKTADTVEGVVRDVAEPSGLDVAALQARVAAVLAEDLYWFPVRHHSPAAARFVEAALQERRPRIVFIEGPAEANHLVKHILHAKTKPPIAIYSSYRDDGNVLGLAGIASPAPDIPARFSSWYPLLEYSPEFVAMKTAKEIGADVVFIDLPYHATIRAVTDQAPAEIDVPDHANVRESDHYFAASDLYRELAKAGGYRTWDEAWDALFEMRTFADHEDYRREMTAFCGGVRATTPRERMISDDTLPRERHMLRTIETTLQKQNVKPSDAVVVCGGFHVFLDRDDKEAPPTPPAGTCYSTVVPYSYFRVSQLSGYGAGNRAPQFYQRIWELRDDAAPDAYLIQHAVATLKQVRKSREPASTADAISVCQHANLLARLRGRPRPVLDDIHDALITCVVKGNPNEEGLHLREAMDHVDIGTAIGKVTPAVGRLPIVQDFYDRVDELDLSMIFEKEKNLRLDLDKRNDLARRQSIFLHRLRFLEIETASLLEGAAADFATGKIFRERWQLRWSPQIEAHLVEQNLYGDTIETAVLARFREGLVRDEAHAGKTCQRLVNAIQLDLPMLMQEVEATCGRSIDQETRFASLGQALGALCVLDRHAIHRSIPRASLESLLIRCYGRACFAIAEAANAPDDQHGEVVSSLLAVAEVVGRDQGLGLDRQLFVEQVRLTARASLAPFLRGVFLGMLVELRDLPSQELTKELRALAQAPVEIMTTAGDFLDGILAVSRTSLLVNADDLVEALDDLLRAAEWDPFLVMLPRLRAAFERLHRHQRDSLAANVAERYGLKKSQQLTELTTSAAAAARIARIDARVAEIMETWN
ncbi:MAG: hypothetical protein HY289_06515 [Planctomycetes bacterium]|nr:hypothetical protein [Planctomycetota bacterium]